jgi:nucleotide-binding universal stress UspA family protein
MKIVLGVDGSPCSLTARDFVGGLRWPVDTTIHMVTAYQVPIDWTGGVGSAMDWVGDAQDAAAAGARGELERLAEPLLDRGLAVEYHVARGRAAEVIVELAAELRADLIVTGSRGRGPIRSMLLGSVAAEVSGHAPCPVIVARGDRVSRVLVAADGSDAAAQIPARLAALAAFRETPIDVVSVVVPDPPAMELMVELYTLADGRLASLRAELTEEATRAAAEMVERLADHGLSGAPHIRRGDAAAEIVRAAETLGVDLVAVGSRGLSGLDRVVLGSVARNVLFHARCSVMITPDQVVVRDRLRRLVAEPARAADGPWPALATA